MKQPRNSNKTKIASSKIDKTFELYPLYYETVTVPPANEYPLDEVFDDSPYSSDVGTNGYKPWMRS